MILAAGVLLLALSVYLFLFYGKASSSKPHLATDAFKEDTLASPEEESIFLDKLPGPLTAQIKSYEKRIPFPVAGLHHRLVKAGSPMGVAEFLIFKALSLAFFLTIGLIFLAKSAPLYLVALVSCGVGFFFPDYWLKNKIARRQQKIRRDLPSAIDLLNLCVSGGLDFMMAVQRIVRDFRPCDLTAELSEAYRETQMGKTRREALKNLAWRIDMPEVSSFVRTLIQADKMGSPIADILKMQSEELRTRRFHLGEAMALKAPIKLLFPLFAFILPVVLILIGAPILLQFNKGSFGF
jgi:tight adherence protein C